MIFLLALGGVCNFHWIVPVDYIDLFDCWQHGRIREVLAFEFNSQRPMRSMALMMRATDTKTL